MLGFHHHSTLHNDSLPDILYCVSTCIHTNSLAVSKSKCNSDFYLCTYYLPLSNSCMQEAEGKVQHIK